MANDVKKLITKDNTNGLRDFIEDNIGLQEGSQPFDASEIQSALDQLAEAKKQKAESKLCSDDTSIYGYADCDSDEIERQKMIEYSNHVKRVAAIQKRISSSKNKFPTNRQPKKKKRK